MILSIGKYIGDKKIGMEDIISECGNENFLREIVGFESVYIESQKTQIEMAECAIKDCLRKQPHISIEEIGVLIFASNSHCKLMPTVALTLVNQLGMRKEDMLALDVNCNCSGELVGIHMAQNLLSKEEGKRKYALVVGCDKFDYVRTKETVVSLTYGDSASAVLIDDQPFEKYEFIQNNNTHYLKEIQLPKGSFSECNGELTLFTDGNPSIQDVMRVVIPQFHQIQEEKGIHIDEVAAFCCTQGSKKIIETVTDELEIPMHKVPFTGKVWGYSGVSCPLLTLDEAIHNGLVKRGDLIWFWSLGAGISSTMMLLKY